MYISIHLNYLTNANYYGAQVFYDKGNFKLANNIQKYLNKYLISSRNVEKIPEKTYMYNKLNVPGVLIECGFLSNEHERNLLITKSYQKKVAKVIARAIVDYYF